MPERHANGPDKADEEARREKERIDERGDAEESFKGTTFTDKDGNKIDTSGGDDSRDERWGNAEEVARIKGRADADQLKCGTLTDKDGNRVDSMGGDEAPLTDCESVCVIPRDTGGGGGEGEEMMAGTVIRDTDGYITFVGKWVTMEYLKKLFNGGPVLRKMPDGEIVEIVAMGTGELYDPNEPHQEQGHADQLKGAGTITDEDGYGLGDKFRGGPDEAEAIGKMIRLTAKTSGPQGQQGA